MNAAIDHIREDQADFLKDPALQAVFDALMPEGEARVVGGAVRNVLMGVEVGDIDLATDLDPERVMALAGNAGLKSVPTGIDHGTVTIISQKKNFEVTTLRADIETFGRHARVKFGENWHGDALRRDFTMNALYCDRDGRLYDPLGGLADVMRRKVRFVGKPELRLQEDYLRILRFFRLHGEYGIGAIDRAGLNACIAAQDGLAQLARMRVRQEMLKLLASARAGEVLRIMSRAKILQRLLPRARRFAMLDRLCKLEAVLGRKPDAILRLAALYGGNVPVEQIEAGLEFTRKERQRLFRLNDVVALPGDIEQAKRALYRLKPQIYLDIVLLCWARTRAGETHQAWQALYDLADAWVIPKFPLGGDDVIARGMASGPMVGRVLKQVEENWIAAGFPRQKSFLKAALDQALAAL